MTLKDCGECCIDEYLKQVTNAGEMWRYGCPIYASRGDSCECEFTTEELEEFHSFVSGIIKDRNRMPELKLYVWEDVLHDWTSGMMCVLAHSLEEAFVKIDEKYEGDMIREAKGSPYKVITEPEAFVVYGGG